MMFDGCKCGLKNRSIFFDIYDFLMHTVHEKNVKMQIQVTK
jgi:hypothetical protein